MKSFIPLMFLFLLVIAAVVGIIAIGAKSNTTPFVDSYNHTTDNQTNTTQDVVVKTATTGTQVGAAAVFLIGGMLVVCTVGYFAHKVF